MKRLAVLLMLLLPLSLGAQKVDNPAVINDYKSVFTMTAPASGSCEVSADVTVFSEDGLKSALMMTVDDDFRTLASFEALVIPQNGGKARKYKMSDVISFSDSDGQIDHSVSKVWVPSSSYPFTVQMKYKVNYRKSIPVFPAFVPVATVQVPVRKASYRLEVPSGTQVKWYASSEPKTESLSKADTYEWEFSDVEAVADEPMRPSVMELVPFVFAAPVEFEYFGTSGNQSTWESLGEWNWSLLPSTELPLQLKEDVLAATDGLSDVAKVRYVYDWLRERTHYVSIQLGVGGYAPMPPEKVMKNGYGDCKALSFMAKSLLAACGVDSDYTALSTTRKNMHPGYASLGQMNHAMLCVPLQRDTVWMECTNPAYPLGYRHDAIAGHEVLLVKESGSKLVRVSSYSADDDVSYSRSVLKLFDDGSALVECSQTEKCSNIESYINIRNWERKKQESNLTRGFRSTLARFSLDGVEDNFKDYDGDSSYIPEMTIRFTMASNRYSKSMGEKLLVPIPVFSRGLDTRRGERKYPVVVKSEMSFTDEVTMDVPAGWKVEALPQSVDYENEFFSLKAEFSSEGSRVDCRINAKAHPGVYPKEAYASFRDLARKFNKVFEANVVLVKE